VSRLLRELLIGSSINEREERRNWRRAEGWKQNDGVSCVGVDVGSDMVRRWRGELRDRRGGGGEGGGGGRAVEVAQNQASLSVSMNYCRRIRLILYVLRCFRFRLPLLPIKMFTSPYVRSMFKCE
jgi:hypothetical protein